MNNRRDFLKLTLAMAATCAAGDLAFGQEEKKARKKGKGKGKGKGGPRKPQIAVQLYAVRGAFEKDVPGTLKAVADMGYKAVEFWGYGGTEKVYKDSAGKEYSAQDLKKLLDDNKIRCCGMHCSVSALEPANLQRTLDNNKVLGNRLVNIAAAGKEMSSPENIKKFAEFLNDASKKAVAQQMRVGYHAHGFDFKKMGDKMAYELLFDQLDKEVNMQVDIGHCINAGADPVAIFKAYPGRSLSVHLREVPDKGYTFDSPKYTEIFQVLETVAGTRWEIVEEEAGTDLTYSEKAIEKLKKLGKV